MFALDLRTLRPSYNCKRKINVDEDVEAFDSFEKSAEEERPG